MSNVEHTQTHLPGHYSKTKPLSVLLKKRILLTKHFESPRKTYFISLDTEGTDLSFQPGDSLGILPQNDPILVNRLLFLLQVDPEEVILDPRSQEVVSLRNYFLSKVNLSRINLSLLKFLAEKNMFLKEEVPFLLESENKDLLSSFVQGKDLIDLFQECHAQKADVFFMQGLTSHLAPLLPRFYSISSSLKAQPNQVDLLVALSSYPHGSELRYGIASHFLCHLAEEKKTKIPLYVQPALHFRLPHDPARPLIMIGPGTGVAPYRAFLQERLALYPHASLGKHWLFFGERNKAVDFFYEEYWTTLEKQGVLRLSTAFSRDQAHKEYVQHKILEQGQEIWDWISQGAYVYVCGNASHMAKDVEATLLSLFQQYGNLSLIEARAYLKTLRTQRQYMTDVY